MQTETILKMHLGEAFENWQDAKMEHDFYLKNYDCMKMQEACYDTLAFACKDIGIELTEEEKEAIKKPLIKKWDEIKRKDAEKWELKEKYFHEIVVPHVESYKEDIENAETSAKARRLKRDLYAFLRASAHMLEMSPVDLEEKLADIL